MPMGKRRPKRETCCKCGKRIAGEPVRGEGRLPLFFHKACFSDPIRKEAFEKALDRTMVQHADILKKLAN